MKTKQNNKEANHIGNPEDNIGGGVHYGKRVGSINKWIYIGCISLAVLTLVILILKS